MNKKRKVVISSLIVIAVTSLFFLLRTPEWSPPDPYWGLAFDSIDEINEIKRILDEGTRSELLQFIEGTNNGENVVKNRRDMRYFFDIIDESVLPSDLNWYSFSYMHSSKTLFVRYEVQPSIHLIVTTPAKGGDESFDEFTERTGANDRRSDVTEEISSLAVEDNFGEDSLRIGNGVKAFSFYDDWGDSSIQEIDTGFDVRVSLNVDGHFVSASVRNAPTLESAFEILTNIEFSLGGGWFDSD